MSDGTRSRADEDLLVRYRRPLAQMSDTPDRMVAGFKQPKLPEPAPRSIRQRYAAGEVSLADLATEYSVGRSTIHRIVHGPETSR